MCRELGVLRNLESDYSKMALELFPRSVTTCFWKNFNNKYMFEQSQESLKHDNMAHLPIIEQGDVITEQVFLKPDKLGGGFFPLQCNELHVELAKFFNEDYLLPTLWVTVWKKSNKQGKYILRAFIKNCISEAAKASIYRHPRVVGPKYGKDNKKSIEQFYNSVFDTKKIWKMLRKDDKLYIKRHSSEYAVSRSEIEEKLDEITSSEMMDLFDKHGLEDLRELYKMAIDVEHERNISFGSLLANILSFLLVGHNKFQKEIIRLSMGGR